MTKGVLVIGGGIAGVQAALDLANACVNTFLIEKSPSLGGKMAQLDKTFPTNDCSMCILSPKLVEAGRHPKIKILANSEVLDCEGEAGNFKVKVLKHARYVDEEKCTGCGACAEKCPKKVPSEFDRGMTTRKAIYIPFPQAVPLKYTIDKITDLLDHRCLYVVFCNPQADEIAPTSANLEKVKSIENLTELNIILIKLLERLYKDAKPIRICINNLDDALIYHKGSTIRKWLTELLPRLKKMGGTVFAPVDPEMHSKEDLHAVLGVFDGQVDVTVEEGEGWIQRRIHVSRMYGLSYSKKKMPI